MLSENLTQANVRAFLQAQGFIGAGGGRFFINGVDTETEGVDIVANYALSTTIGDFGFTFGANFTSTDVTAVPAIPVLSALTPPPELFSRINILTFEEGNPKDKFTSPSIGNSAPSRPSCAPSVTARCCSRARHPPTTRRSRPRRWSMSKARWSLTDDLRLSIGADNVLDEYPDALRPSLNTTNNTPFTSTSPFGYSGRFVYARAALDF